MRRTLITLNETVHDRVLCEPGDILEIKSGHRYEVVEVDGLKIKAAVMKASERIADGARILQWAYKPTCKPKDGLPICWGSTT